MAVKSSIGNFLGGGGNGGGGGDAQCRPNTIILVLEKGKLWDKYDLVEKERERKKDGPPRASLARVFQILINPFWYFE